MSKLKLIFVTLIMLVLVTSMVSAMKVTRSLEKKNNLLEVTLDVKLDSGDWFYIIEETYPAGWTVNKTGTGTDNKTNIKWVASSVPPISLSDTKYTYILNIPSSQKSIFSGKYSSSTSTDQDITGVTTYDFCQAKENEKPDVKNILFLAYTKALPVFKNVVELEKKKAGSGKNPQTEGLAIMGLANLGLWNYHTKYNEACKDSSVKFDGGSPPKPLVDQTVYPNPLNP